MRPPAPAGEGQWSGAGLLEQALTRAAGAPLVGGNKVRILHDAAEHYPAWLGAIRTAERTIFFESYIVHDDECGAEFAEALAERARSRGTAAVPLVPQRARSGWDTLSRQRSVTNVCCGPPRAWIVAVLGIMLLVAAAAAVQWPLVAALPAAAVGNLDRG